jgi:glycosyltransferase involved in cell wall biosynthesis
MKNILHITKGKKGGLDFISKEIFEYLNSYFRQKILYFSSEGKEIYNIFPNEKVFVFGYKEEVLFANFFNKINDFIKADIIHVHHTKLWILTSPLFFFSKKVYFSFHMSFGSGIHKSFVENALIYLIVSYCSLFSSKLIFLTHGQKELIKKSSLFKKTLEKKSKIIPNFINKNNILKKRKKVNYDVLFVGRFTKIKGFYDLIELSKENTDINFYAIGDNRSIYASDNFVSLGESDHSNINYFYDKYSIFILPSYTEAFPLTILESMARGLVVLVSNLPGLDEIVKEGENGYLFAPGDVDKMKRILVFLKSNPKEIERISANNLKAVLSFSSDKVLNMYKEIYE